MSATTFGRALCDNTCGSHASQSVKKWPAGGAPVQPLDVEDKEGLHDHLVEHGFAVVKEAASPAQLEVQ